MESVAFTHPFHTLGSCFPRVQALKDKFLPLNMKGNTGLSVSGYAPDDKLIWLSQGVAFHSDFSNPLSITDEYHVLAQPKYKFLLFLRQGPSNVQTVVGI